MRFWEGKLLGVVRRRGEVSPVVGTGVSKGGVLRLLFNTPVTLEKDDVLELDARLAPEKREGR